MTLSTGNNSALEGPLLSRMAKQLVSAGAKHLSSVDDIHSVYAAKMQSADGQLFYLVAKGSKMWAPEFQNGVPFVSIQKTLITRAQRLNIPIILAHLQDGWTTPNYAMYHPEKVMMSVRDNMAMTTAFENTRFAVQMINFPYETGIRFHGSFPKNTHETWKELCRKWTTEKNRLFDQQNLGRFFK